ncbi:hypothetical protein NliqN6_4371 [Naganishia liquefaciens]|uniref:ABC transporter domain-containing protein n=1 Tax=Naganishia liquefaciens TaxID=104408 RepID=A0A8H3YFT3_9TREE|nr:hypothetical protein NliqN6_4371 [Naganishia liquefaciens]
MAPLLTVRNLTLRTDSGKPIFENINLDVDEGEVLVLKGRSGSGKTTLLKCIAELVLYQEGEIRLHGKKASEYGVPNYRTKVLYVPQRPSLLPGTPQDFLTTILSYSSRHNAIPKGSKDARRAGTGQPVWERALEVSREWGMDGAMWRREWATLSGGEAQRMGLACAVALGMAEVLLLDEPTSALDPESIKKVEKTLLSLLPNGDKPDGTLKTLVWITHEAAQGDRVGTRTFDVSEH